MLVEAQKSEIAMVARSMMLAEVSRRGSGKATKDGNLRGLGEILYIYFIRANQNSRGIKFGKSSMQQMTR